MAHNQKVGIVEHNQRIDDIVEAMIPKGYKFIHRNMEYEYNGYRGEVDIIAFNRYDHLRFIEYKCHHSYKSFHKAEEQYTRFKDAFAHTEIKGLYIAGGIDTPIVVKPLRYIEHRK